MDIADDAPDGAQDGAHDGAVDGEAGLAALAEAYAARRESTSAHPITATSTRHVREVLGGAFSGAVEGLGALGDGGPPDVEVTTGRVELPPREPREPGSGGVETTTTRTAETDLGRVVLHETATRRGDGSDDELRTTIALTGSSVDGSRFWLGATSYAGGPIDRLELVGDLPAFAAPVLGEVLTALRR